MLWTNYIIKLPLYSGKHLLLDTAAQNKHFIIVNSCCYFFFFRTENPNVPHFLPSVKYSPCE